MLPGTITSDIISNKIEEDRFYTIQQNPNAGLVVVTIMQNTWQGETDLPPWFLILKLVLVLSTQTMISGPSNLIGLNKK